MDLQHGLMDHDIREAEVSRANISNTGGACWWLIDRSKWTLSSYQNASFMWIAYTPTTSPTCNGMACQACKHHRMWRGE
jgi:hypothetical protein